MFPEHELVLVDIDTAGVAVAIVVVVAVARIAAPFVRVHGKAVAVAVHMFRQLSAIFKPHMDFTQNLAFKCLSFWLQI